MDDQDLWSQQSWESDQRVATRTRRLGYGCAGLTVGGTAFLVIAVLSLALAVRSCNVGLTSCENSGVPLIAAAADANLRDVEGRIERGDDVDEWDADENTALSCAAEVDGGDEVIGALLEAGADPERPGAEAVPLSAAVGARLKPNVEALLRGGANPDGADGYAPLVTAVDGHVREIAALLLEAGADPNLSNEGRTALMAAVESTPQADGTRDSDASIVRLLVDHGADPSILSTRQVSSFTVLIQGGGDSPVVPPRHSPLFQATFIERADLVEALLDGNADPDLGGDVTFEEVGLTLLNVTNAHDVPLGAAEADGLYFPTSRLDATDRGNVQPLLVAAMNNDAVTFTLLLEAGADPNLTTFDAYTPLYAAAWVGDTDMVQALLDAGADPNPLPPNMKETPVQAARIRGHTEVVALLAAAGAPPP